MLPSVFGENLFDGLLDNCFARFPASGVHDPLYGRYAKNLMKQEARSGKKGGRFYA